MNIQMSEDVVLVDVPPNPLGWLSTFNPVTYTDAELLLLSSMVKDDDEAESSQRDHPGR